MKFWKKKEKHREVEERKKTASNRGEQSKFQLQTSKREEGKKVEEDRICEEMKD
jgi:hypothetical protein